EPGELGDHALLGGDRPADRAGALDGVGDGGDPLQGLRVHLRLLPARDRSTDFSHPIPRITRSPVRTDRGPGRTAPARHRACGGNACVRRRAWSARPGGRGRTPPAPGTGSRSPPRSPPGRSPTGATRTAGRFTVVRA